MLPKDLPLSIYVDEKFRYMILTFVKTLQGAWTSTKIRREGNLSMERTTTAFVDEES